MFRSPNLLTYRNALLSEAAYGGLPVSAWMLDEVNGTSAANLAALARGSGDVGTYTGTYTLGASGPFNRENSRALSLAGAGYVTIPDSATLTVTDLTIEAWVKNTSGSSDIQLIFEHLGGATNYGMYIDASGLFRGFAAFSTGQDNASGSGSVRDSLWHHLAFTRSDADDLRRFYVDGVQVGTAADTQTGSANPTESAFIGARLSGGFAFGFVGSIAAVAFYNYALAADRIRYHHLAGTNGVMQ